MKKAILVGIITMLSINLFAQTTYEIEVDSVNKIEVILDYNNPLVLPKYRVHKGILLFDSKYIGLEVIVPFNIDFEYRPYSNLSFNLNYYTVYGREFDDNIGNKDDPNIKTFNQIDVVGHYSLISVFSESEHNIFPKKQNKKGYYLKFPALTLKEVALDFGLYKLRYASEERLKTIDRYRYYYSGNHTSFSLQGGLSYSRSLSYKAISEVLGRRIKYKTLRFYINGTMALVNEVDYFYNDNVQTTEINAADIGDQVKKRIGYKVGIRTNSGISRIATSSWFGLEYARVPHVYINDKLLTAKGMLTINFGIGFGGKPRLLKPTKLRNKQL